MRKGEEEKEETGGEEAREERTMRKEKKGDKAGVVPSRLFRAPLAISSELLVSLLPLSLLFLARKDLAVLQTLPCRLDQSPKEDKILTLPKTLAASPYAALDSEGAATTAATPAIMPRAARRSMNTTLGAGAAATLADAPASLEARTATVRGRAMEAEIIFVVS